MRIFVLILTGLSKISKKILNNNDLFDENADFDYFRPFLACFWPDMTLIFVSKALDEYICPNFDWIE